MPPSWSLPDTLRCPVAHRADLHPDDAAICTPERLWTYREMDEAVTATARALQSAGISAGSVVGMRMERSPGAVILLWAIWRIGATAAPLSVRLPAEGLRAAARRCGIQPVITDESRIAGALSDASIGALSASEIVRWTTGGSGAGSQAPSWNLDRDATLVFTSGSTGTPKAALHTLRNHVASARGSNANTPVEAGHRWLLSLPLYHVGGLAVLFRCALGGGAVAIPTGSRPLGPTVEVLDATHLSLVATQARRLLDRMEENGGEAGALLTERLRAVLIGGGAVPAELLDRAVAAGWPVHTTYGCTEMASQVTTTAPGASRDALATAGSLLPHRALRIDVDGPDPGEDEETTRRVGEILLRGDTLFRGYVQPAGEATSGAGDATATDLDPARDEEGWYHSGDRGWMDERGRLHVVGRVDRMFISGGENIQPEELESALERIDGIDRAVVVPVSDADYGRRPVAFVAAADHSVVAWRQSLAEHLPAFKIPDAFEPLPAEAVDGRMKVDRHALRNRAEAAHGTAGRTDD